MSVVMVFLDAGTRHRSWVPLMKAGFKDEGAAQSPRGFHKTECTDFIETCAYLKSPKISAYILVIIR
jgi:hypothetical protein